ncbi:hypothetical protein [Streptomyces sp. NPDC004267]|uniref:hypothetical protein n=1 Tax=Streptomyces sp. NPDC004267 TaxID=3364694 RepID=UPI0036C36C14
MLPESIPMDWLCAEYVADDLLRASGLVAPGSLEFRAGVQTLALTILLSRAGGDGTGTDGWLRRTAHDHPWSSWVEERLAEAGAGLPSSDLELARDTWRRLRATELRAADLAGLAGLAGPRGIDEERQVWLPAWQLGVALGHLALHLC